MKINNIRRLMAIDAALADGGMNRAEMATAWGCDKKTIQRDHDLIREIVSDGGLQDEAGYWRYADRRNRLFRTRGEQVRGGPVAPPTLAEVVRSAREKAAMSQGQLARKSGMSLDTIHKIEIGKNEQSRPETLRRLAAALKITHTSLMQARQR